MLDTADLRQFHTERRERKVTVICEKSSLPMLWLDSSVLIDFAKVDNKENLDKVRVTKLTRLRTLTRKAVRAGKLICPEWEQSLEFEGKRLERQISRVISDLSCGAHCVPHAGVKDQQILRGLKAYLSLAESVHIPAHIHFYRDPAKAVSEAIETGLIVEAEMPKPRQWLEKANYDKHQTQIGLEAIRLRCSASAKTFGEQLAIERVGESDVMLGMQREFMKNVLSGKYDFWEFMSVQGYLQYQSWWRDMAGPGPDFAALYSFMRSPYYWELPIEDIACRLYADLMTKPPEVKSGDSHDIQHLATAIPVAHYVLADRAMVDRCERLGIGTKWKTRLYSARNLDELCRELERLT
jgi:hypothetical protein